MNEAFTNIKTNPVGVVMHGLGQYAELIRRGDKEGICFTTGLCLGVAMYHGAGKSPDLVQIIKAYNERNAKARGGNVVDFFKAKAGRTT